MRRLFVLFFIFSILLVACDKENDPVPSVPDNTEQTVFMFIPYADDLIKYFDDNISDIQKAIAQGVLEQSRYVVFYQRTPSEAALFELKYENGRNVRDTLQVYQNPAITTVEGISSFLEDVKMFAPANRYATVVGCHGMGWIPVSRSRAFGVREKEYWENEGEIKTRYFGGKSSNYQIEVTDFADAIKSVDMKMEYILFDDCYMSGIEVAYDLKDVADYLIASTSEVMAYGMPYSEILEYMVGTVDPEAICRGFYDFYSRSYGTLAVTDCAEVESMAAVMRKINDKFKFDVSLRDNIQRLDGYTPVRFFDFEDYVANLCTDPDLLAEFKAQLKRVVPYKTYTDEIYSMSWNSGRGGAIKLNTFSGLTISDPSISPETVAKTATNWYKATH